LEKPSFASQFGVVEFIRRLREDQLSVLTPDLFDRDLLYVRRLFLHGFVLNHPDYIEQVLLTNHVNYGKSNFVRHMLGPVLGNGLLISEGELWRRQRRIMAPAFHTRRIADFVAVMASCAEAALTRWQTLPQPFDITAEMRDLSLAIIGRTMFSTDLGRDANAVRRLMDTFIALRPGVLDLFGFPAWFSPRPSRAFRQDIAEFEALFARMMAQRRSAAADTPDAADAADAPARHDLLSMLLAARDPETGEGMTDKQLRDEVLTIVAAGHETVATALSWTWYLLAQNPSAEARLHAELDRVLGGRAPTYADLAALPWTRMVLEESMRLYPPAHTMSRTALGEDRIGGVRVPKGALISINIYVTHRNPKLWPDPERFDPERFAPAAAAQRHRFAYLPFGGGPRICIGNGFAMTEALVVLATVAQRFRVRLLAGEEVRPVGLITLRPRDGIRVTLEPRKATVAATALAG
jgi:cytochrome P450